jgi:UDP-2,4-diacetamido-2,4,6-trideoxy-beta-L-altropyranose hydrolase
MRFLFRCNAGPTVGFGHLMRCRVLAQALVRKGHTAAIFGPPISYCSELDRAILSIWRESPAWTSAADDARQLLLFARNCSASFLVLDDYRIDETYQQVLHEAGMHWAQFESSTSKPILADIVLNSSPNVNHSAYARALHNPKGIVMLGPRYAIIRPEFRRPAPARRIDALKQILVMFGAGDDRGAITRMLEVLIPVTSEGVRVLIVSGQHNPNNPLIAKRLADLSNHCISLVIDPADIASLMHSSDLAVLAGGTATFEAAACGLPMMIIAIADNQLSQAKAWAEYGVAVYAGSLEAVDNAHLKGAFIEATKISRRRSMSMRAKEIVDACGVDRVADAMVILGASFTGCHANVS